MTDVARLLARARAFSGLSQRQTAAVAGVSTSTVSRIERGELDPTIATLERVLVACGFRYGDGLRPNVDVDAVRAARRVLEPELEIPATLGSDEWFRRWEAAGLLRARTKEERVNELCVRAAQQAELGRRPGARLFVDRGWKAIARDLNAAGEPWALTGAFAALAYTKIAVAVRTDLYVADVERAACAAGLESSCSGPYVALIPFDEVTSAGVQQLDSGVRLASYWQIAIDCFAGNDRMPDQAEDMIRKAVFD
jgi:transcriptional regulator with XRE-family HTH domain